MKKYTKEETNMKKCTRKTTRVAGLVLLLVGVYVSLGSQLRPAWGITPWVAGDVFVGVASGSYQVYDNAGTFKEAISDGLGGFTTGCAFNPPLTKLYTTNFSSSQVVVYDDPSPHSILQTILDPDGGLNESIVFAANGDFYVGHPLIATIHKYDAAGTLLTTFAVGPTDLTGGPDWIDLAANQTTLFYDGEGRLIRRFDTVTGQLADFAVLPGSGNAYALRLLPPGDGSGGLLVADGFDIKRLDGSGTVVQTYDVAGEDSWFSLNLDPNGTSFWAGDFGSSNFYRFNIATGTIEVGPINTETGSFTLFGVCVKGEPTAALPKEDTRRMTGGGSVFTKSGMRVTHGFELHCDTSLPNNLQINWGGNRFHLTQLTSATCSDTAISEGHPVAGFDTFVGAGVGRLNGVAGATINFTLTDAGEPGKGVDLADFSINAGAALAVSGTLNKGNQQAHPK